ncbi:hypothetical protein [Succinivibrio dextrinosolvens]|uniref:hypothetical protein n=1 Tax=Succinivibrio dextrinosolvens TaxID=83771 RepID=UPI00241DDC1D|nr:hypothetical protein [Succinivibrio dextrinosolvens]MBE6424227.1 hypothetical protein [Succinivibrio dextrinosolvens]
MPSNVSVNNSSVNNQIPLENQNEEVLNNGNNVQNQQVNNDENHIENEHNQNVQHNNLNNTVELHDQGLEYALLNNNLHLNVQANHALSFSANHEIAVLDNIENNNQNVNNNQVVNNNQNINNNQVVNNNQNINNNQSVNNNLVGAGNPVALGNPVEEGKDWNFNEAEGMKEVAKNAVENIKKEVSGEAKINELLENLSSRLEAERAAHPNSNVIAQLEHTYEDIKVVLEDLKNARQSLTTGLDSGLDTTDPLKALSQIRKSLRVFRYETQVSLSKQGIQTQKMGIMEGGLRRIQNFFTFGVGKHINENDISSITELETLLNEKLLSFNDKLKALNVNVSANGNVNANANADVELIYLPDNFLFKTTINDTLEVSHRTNDQIRLFQDKSRSNAYLQEMLKNVSEKGVSRKVEFTVGAGALIGLGFPETVTAGVRVGARLKIIADMKGEGPGKPITVTYRIGGGLEGKLMTKFGNDSVVAGLKAEAGGSVLVTHFTTRKYANADDVIRDAKNCKLATSRTVGSAIWGAVKSVGGFFGNLGVKAFRFMGRHSGEVLQTNQVYLESLKARGYAGQLDSVLAKRANPMIIAENTGYTSHFSANISAGIGLFGDALSLKGSISGEHQRDFKVQSKFFAPVAKLIREQTDTAHLESMLREDPVSETAENIVAAADIENQYNELIAQTKSNPPKNDKEWSSFANKIRTLLISVEHGYRSGDFSREMADRLLNRFSNPEIKMPNKIFREYMMDGTGDGKPAKKRNSFSAQLKVGVFENTTKGMTSEITNGIVKGVADGVIQQGRKEIGLDSTFGYSFSSEKPVGNDPRPWENVVKTNHSIVVSANAPIKAIIDFVTKVSEQNHKALDPAEQQTKTEILKDVGKDVVKSTLENEGKSALVALIISSAKEGAKAAVINWLKDPENLSKVITFALDHAGEAFEAVVNVVEWVAEHPELASNLVDHFMALKDGISSDTNRTKTINLSYVDGSLESVNVSSTTTTKIGVNVEPLGVGVGVAFDMSYSVSETVKDRSISIGTSLNSLLEKTENTLLTDVSLVSGSGEALKNYLSRNITGIKSLLPELKKAGSKSQDIIERSKTAAGGDQELINRINDANIKINNLTATSTDDEIVDAFHDLLIPVTLAYRSQLQPAA